MSWEVELWVKRQKTGNPVLKAVLLSIGNWIDPQNNWQVVSIRRLADETEVSERTVQRHIATLIDMGFLEREERQRPGGGSGWNAYRMRGYAPLRVSNIEPIRPAQAPEDAEKRGDNLTPPGCQPVTGGGDSRVTPILKKDTIPPTPNGVAPQGAAAGQSMRADRGTRLPVDWEPAAVADLPPAARNIAGGWPRGAYVMVAEQFRCHWHGRADRGCRKKDWGKAWQEWLLKAPRDVAAWQRAGVDFAAMAPAAAATVEPPAGKVGCERVQAIRNAVLSAVGDRTFAAWIRPLDMIIEGRRLVIATGSRFHLDWVRNHFSSQISSAAHDLDLHWLHVGETKRKREVNG